MFPEMSSKRPTKRRRLNPPETATNSTNDNVTSMADAISAAVTAKVMDNLKESGIFPKEKTSVDAAHTIGNTESPNEAAVMGMNNTNVSPNVQPNIIIPAHSLCSTTNLTHQSVYKPLGRPLYTKINVKLQEKIRSKDYIDMSDILTDHHPAELDLHLAVHNNRVGLTSGKKRKFLTIENWTDAFMIFSSVVRKANPNHPTISEDLAIYMDLIRQINKDGGDWYFYDINFRQSMQNDDTLSWSYVDQVLHTRALNRPKQRPIMNSNPNKPFPYTASRKTCHKYNKNGGRACNGSCGYLHQCFQCNGNHPMSLCPKQKFQGGGNQARANDANAPNKPNASSISFPRTNPAKPASK